METDTDQEQMQFYIGQIMPWPGPIGTIPEGWMLCAGQVLPINGNATLYSLIGPWYGGDGQHTFGLPNLVGRIPIGRQGGVNLGATGGKTGGSFTLPAHSHPISYPLTPYITATTAQATVSSPTAGTPVMLATPVGVDSGGTPLSFDIYASQSDAEPDIVLSSGAVPITITIEAAGNGGSTATLPAQGPYIALNYIICTNGRYPFPGNEQED